MTKPISLSKTKFTTGLQCHKLLWWTVHEPKSPELIPDEVLKSIFATGNKVGELAREHLGPGFLVEAAPWEKDRKVALTQGALAAGERRIFEASFEHGGVFAAVDALEVTPDGMRLMEVKSTTSLHPEHLPDIALQRWVMEGSGHPVMAAELVHLSSECRAPDLSNLFARDDVTAQTAGLQAGIGPEVSAQLQMLAGPLPEIEVGPQCTRPRKCAFYDRCWKDVPKHHVGTLSGIRAEGVLEFKAKGITTIDQIPENAKLSPRQATQRRAVIANAPIIDQKALHRELAAYDVGTIAFLDFETVNEAVPVWDGCKPFDQVPVQMSCHVQTQDSQVTHHAWIASGPEDPMPGCAKAVVDACRGADIVVVWSAQMERTCIKRLAVGAPALAKELEGVSARLVDMMDVAEAGIYHPDFLGSYGLKPVVETLLPTEKSYSRLAVGEGMLASVRLRRLMFEGDSISPAERERMRAELLEYCGHDTVVMVELLKILRQIASTGRL